MLLFCQAILVVLKQNKSPNAARMQPMNLDYDFTDSQLRESANLRQHYEAWRKAKLATMALNHRLSWEKRGAREYLYKRSGKVGNGTSLGVRSEATEITYAKHVTDKTSAQERLNATFQRLDERARICAALGLGLFAAPAAKILRAADLDGVLGSRYMVVGTNAMLAYELEAGHRFAYGLEATEDFDLAFTAGRTTFVAQHSQDSSTSLFALLKRIDSTYTANTERTFQALNKDGFEVELLAAPSVISSLAPDEVLTPISNMPEQEWLLLGTPVFQVACATDRSPVPIVVPDPRWMGLHKLWLSKKPERNKLKATKDAKQGNALLSAVRSFMPQFPLNSEFERGIPPELRPYYDAWLQTAPAADPATWGNV